MNRFLLWILGIGWTAAAAVAGDTSDITLSTLMQDAADSQTTYLPKEGFAGLWSSIDRNGGHLDEQGYIRKEENEYVLAEMMGPGAVTRIWFKHPKGTLSLYVDEGGQPILQIPAADLLKGKVKPFTPPWVSYDPQTESGFSFVPIPYHRFCKITATQPFAFDIDYLTYPTQTTVEPFQIPWTKNHLATQSALAKKLLTTGAPPFQPDKTYVEDAYAFTVPAAETVNFATFSGPAVIRGIQLQWDESATQSGRDLVLLIYWDNHPEPAVRVPVMDFFGGKSQTWLLGTKQNNEGYCYFPMPYQTQARMVVRNDHLHEDIPVHITVFVQSVSAWKEPLRRFHAGWLHSMPTVWSRSVEFDSQYNTPISNMDQAVPLFQTDAIGHLAAVTLCQIPNPDSDVLITTSSGMRKLSLSGSSISAFMNETGVPPTRGKSVAHPFSSTSNLDNSHTFSTRLFLPTPFQFESVTRFVKESGHANLNPQPFSACVLWYQENQDQPYLPFPAASARRITDTQMHAPRYLFQAGQLSPVETVEAENADVSVIGGAYEPQDMSPHGAHWRHNQALKFDAYTDGSELSIRMPEIEYSGWYSLTAFFSRSPHGGIFDILLQDQVVYRGLDLYHETLQPLAFTSPDRIFFHAGESLSFNLRSTGSNRQSSGKSAGIDFVELQSAPLIPDAVNITGPLMLKATPTRSIHKETVNPHMQLPVGFKNRLRSQTLHADNQAFELDCAIDDNTEEAYWVASFKVQASHSGIYRFEVHGDAEWMGITRRSESDFESIPHHLWINGIALPAEDRRFWSVETHSILPPRYPVPLQRGSNTILWVMPCRSGATFIPKIYGLRSDRSG